MHFIFIGHGVFYQVKYLVVSFFEKKSEKNLIFFEYLKFIKLQIFKEYFIKYLLDFL